MKELPWTFCGELPAQTMDETRMPRDLKKAGQVDPLKRGESSKALCLDVSELLGCTTIVGTKPCSSVCVALLLKS